MPRMTLTMLGAGASASSGTKILPVYTPIIIFLIVSPVLDRLKEPPFKEEIHLGHFLVNVSFVSG